MLGADLGTRDTNLKPAWLSSQELSLAGTQNELQHHIVHCLCVSWLPSPTQCSNPLPLKKFLNVQPMGHLPLNPLGAYMVRARGHSRPCESYFSSEPRHLHFNNSYAHCNVRTTDWGAALISLVIMRCDMKGYLNTVSNVQGVIWSFPHTKLREEFHVDPKFKAAFIFGWRDVRIFVDGI